MDGMPPGARAVRRRRRGARERRPGDAVFTHADLARLGERVAWVAALVEGVLEDDQIDPGTVDDRVRLERDDNLPPHAERNDVETALGVAGADRWAEGDVGHLARAEAGARPRCEGYDLGDEASGTRTRIASSHVAPST